MKGTRERLRRFCLDPGLETRNEEETMRDKERGYIQGAERWTTNSEAKLNGKVRREGTMKNE